MGKNFYRGNALSPNYGYNNNFYNANNYGFGNPYGFGGGGFGNPYAFGGGFYGRGCCNCILPLLLLFFLF